MKGSIFVNVLNKRSKWLTMQINLTAFFDNIYQGIR